MSNHSLFDNQGYHPKYPYPTVMKTQYRAYFFKVCCSQYFFDHSAAVCISKLFVLKFIDQSEMKPKNGWKSLKFEDKSKILLFSGILIEKRKSWYLHSGQILDIVSRALLRWKKKIFPNGLKLPFCKFTDDCSIDYEFPRQNCEMYLRD